MAIAYGARAGSDHANTNGATQTVTTTAAIPAGSTIIVSVSASNVGDTSNLTSVTDTAGNTYQSGGFTCDGGQNTMTAVWYATNAALASGGTVTVTFHAPLLTGGESWEITVDYLTGGATASATDGSTGRNGGNAQTGATWDTRTGGTTDLATTNAADLLWAAYGVNQGGPLALVQANCLPSSGWTELAAVSGGAGNNNQLRSAYTVVAATGSYRAAGSATAGNNGISAVLVAFKAGASSSTFTRTVPASVALLATATRAVPSSAALLATNTRQAPASAALQATNTRTVPASAALLQTLNRAIPASAALVATQSRTVPSSAALRSTQTRTVTASGALLATNTRQIVASAALSGGASVRTIPASAALVATLTRQTPASTALLATLTRAVPSSAALRGTFTRTIQASAALVVPGAALPEPICGAAALGATPIAGGASLAGVPVAGAASVSSGVPIAGRALVGVVS